MAKVPVAAYIDGFNLYNGMHDARKRRGLWLDIESLLNSFLGANQELVAVHYFTALVMGSGKPRQQVYSDALREHGQVTTTHVGRFQRKVLDAGSASSLLMCMKRRSLTSASVSRWLRTWRWGSTSRH